MHVLILHMTYHTVTVHCDLNEILQLRLSGQELQREESVGQFLARGREKQNQTTELKQQ